MAKTTRISAQQSRFYWAEWNATKKILLRSGGVSDDEIEDTRKELHRAAQVTKDSHKDFTNSDLNRVIRKFREARGDQGGADAVDAQVRGALIRQIERFENLAPSYLEKVASSIFGSPNWRKFPAETLEKFRNICRARSRQLGRKSKFPE